MPPSSQHTIYALATAPGRAALAVVRVSGPGASGVADLFACALPPPRVASLRRLHHGGRLIDQALFLHSRAPHSYTGEDMVELHIHGGRATCDAILDALSQAGGLRAAEPGEFTRRAVRNGRMDLTAAEAVNDLVNAETEAQRALALNQMEGRLAAQFEGWADSVTRARAHLEAFIDFPDEDLPAEARAGIVGDLAACAAEIEKTLADGRRGERLRDGLRIAVVGPANAGKSSFVNWLADRDVAIVSPRAGTTRDVIETHLDLAGYPVIVADTAGLRDPGDLVKSDDAIEQEGIKRALAWARTADLTIFMVDGLTGGGLGEGPGDRSAPAPADPVSADRTGWQDADLLLVNKMDLMSPNAAPARPPLPDNGFAISVRTGAGLDAVVKRLGEMARAAMEVGDLPALTRPRHREALAHGLDGLRRAVDGLRPNEVLEPEVPEPAQTLELVAEELRSVGDALGRVTGRVDVEDLLDVIFRDFCIGK